MFLWYLEWFKCGVSDRKSKNDIVAEWLRRETRNLMGSPAQVRILPMSDILINLIILQIQVFKLVY